MTNRFRVVRKRLASNDGSGRVYFMLVLAVALMALVVAGCGGGGSASSGEGETASSGESEEAASTESEESASSGFPEEEIPQGPNSAKGLGKKTVGMIVITQASELFPAEQKATEDAFGALGWSLKIDDLGGDISKVPNDVESLVQSGVDAIVLASVEPSFVGKQALAAAKAANVPIIGQFTGVPTEKSEGVLTAAIEGPLGPPGKAEGELVVEQFGEGAEVAMIIDQLASTGKQAQAGFEEGMAGKTKVVAKHQLDYAKIVPDATATAEQWLVQHPNLSTIWCPYDGACVGVGQAVLGVGSEVAVMSISGTPGAFDLIREGVNYTTWAIPLTYMPWRTTDLLVSVLAGNEFEPTVEVPSFEVNASNVTESGTLPEEEIFGNFEEEFEERWGVK